MSIFSNIFGAAPNTAKPATAPAVNQPPGATVPPGSTQTTLGTHVSETTAPNGVVPVQPPASPLDKYGDIWKDVPNATGNESVFGEIDPQKIMEAASRVDFTQVISPEVLAKITAGGEGAAAAFASSLNKVAQTVYAQNALATTKIVEQATSKQRDSFQALLPGLIRKHSVSEGLRNENPLLSNPAVAPIVQALQSQIQLKNPTATDAEVREQVMEYMQGFATTFAPQPVASKGKAKATQDWDNYFTS